MYHINIKGITHELIHFFVINLKLYLITTLLQWRSQDFFRGGEITVKRVSSGFGGAAAPGLRRRLKIFIAKINEKLQILGKALWVLPIVNVNFAISPKNLKNLLNSLVKLCRKIFTIMNYAFI